MNPTNQMNPHTATYDTPLPLVLAGARGHGRWHLENIRRLQDKGIVRLAGICELTPLSADEIPDGLGTPEQSADFGALLDSTGAAIAVICTPIPTHTDLALIAARQGRAPPAGEAAGAVVRRVPPDGRRGRGGRRRSARSASSRWARTPCPRSAKLVAEGAIGEVVGIGGAGAWARDEAYYRRAPWAGKRRLNGVDVIDGALTNPLAHAVATALALAGATRAEDVTAIETELLRANDIESDDTSCVRVTTADGAPDHRRRHAVRRGPGRAVRRRARHQRPDHLLVQAGPRAASSAPDTARRRSSTAAPTCWRTSSTTSPTAPTCWSRPTATGAFMRVVEAIRVAPDPVALPGRRLAPAARRATRRVVARHRRPGRGRRRHPRPLLRTGRLLGAPRSTGERGEHLMTTDDSLVLRVAGRPVGRYVTRPELPAAALAPPLSAPRHHPGRHGGHRTEPRRPPPPPRRRCRRSRRRGAQLLGRAHLRPRPGPDRARQPRRPAPHRLPAARPRRLRRGTALGGGRRRAAARAPHGRGHRTHRLRLGVGLHLLPHQRHRRPAVDRQPRHQRPPRRRVRRLLLAGPQGGRAAPASSPPTREGEAAVHGTPRRLARPGRRQLDAGLRRGHRQHPPRPVVRPRRRVPGRRLLPRPRPSGCRSRRARPSYAGSSPSSPTAASTGTGPRPSSARR